MSSTCPFCFVEICNNIFIGSFSLGLMALLAITSIPSVSSTLSWREFIFIQSKFGWWCLFCALFHLIFKKWGSIFTDTIRCIFLPDPSQVSLIILQFTL